VDAAISERKGERIAAHSIVQAMPRRGNEREGTIDGHSAQREAAPARDLTCSPGEVGEAGSDVEESGAWLAVSERRTVVGGGLDDFVEQRADGEHDSAAA